MLCHHIGMLFYSGKFREDRALDRKILARVVIHLEPIGIPFENHVSEDFPLRWLYHIAIPPVFVCELVIS